MLGEKPSNVLKWKGIFRAWRGGTHLKFQYSED